MKETGADRRQRSNDFLHLDAAPHASLVLLGRVRRRSMEQQSCTNVIEMLHASRILPA